MAWEWKDELRQLVRKGWWIEPRATVECAVSADGLLIAFPLAVEPILDKHYPRKGDKWFFNDSMDREIAEVEGVIITANPRVLWDHFLPKGA